MPDDQRTCNGKCVRVMRKASTLYGEISDAHPECPVHGTASVGPMPAPDTGASSSGEFDPFEKCLYCGGSGEQEHGSYDVDGNPFMMACENCLSTGYLMPVQAIRALEAELSATKQLGPTALTPTSAPQVEKVMPDDQRTCPRFLFWTIHTFGKWIDHGWAYRCYRKCSVCGHTEWRECLEGRTCGFGCEREERHG